MVSAALGRPLYALLEPPGQYLERRSEWDEERKNKLARLNERYHPTSLLASPTPS